MRSPLSQTAKQKSNSFQRGITLAVRSSSQLKRATLVDGDHQTTVTVSQIKLIQFHQMRHARQNAHINGDLPYKNVSPELKFRSINLIHFDLRMCSVHITSDSLALAHKYLVSPSLPFRVECDLLDLNIRVPPVDLVRHVSACAQRKTRQEKRTNQPTN